MASFRVVCLFGCLVAVCFAAVQAEPARYDNYRVYRLSIDRMEQLEVLQLIEQFPDGFAFLSDPVHVNTTVKLVVPPHKMAEFVALNEKFSLKAEVAFENLQTVIDRQMKGRREVFGWTAYHPLEDINDWLDTLVAQYPDVVTPIVAGQTYEGRQIRGVKVSYKAGNPAVFTEGTIHAREWISAATVTWVLNQLLTSQEPAVRNIAENYDWYVIPVANPDGYVYTHTTTRLWRKTRSRQNVLCFGADPNRNWDYMFNHVASGSSLDWVKGTLKTPLTFAYELRDTGEYGFLLPPEQIIPTAEETLDSIIVILEEGKAMGYH
uniref:Zinc carboxypeptidase A 1 n=1 Tax=Anopheles atroparvus TaxID=41427 RepID=A0A182JCX5_ANOAO